MILKLLEWYKKRKRAAYVKRVANTALTNCRAKWEVEEAELNNK